MLLYELLTGTTPLTRERLKNVSNAEAMRLIREEEVPSPSTRVSESKDDSASVAEKRHLKPAALVKMLRGDLDCLVMKALEKDRARRYETVNDLAHDIQRYLAHESLEACPSSVKRALWKEARKHRRLAAAVGMMVLLLIVAVAGASVAAWALHKEGQARKAEQESAEKSKKAQKAEEETKGKLRQAEEARKATEKERDQAKADKKAIAAFGRRHESDPGFLQGQAVDRGPSGGRVANGCLLGRGQE